MNERYEEYVNETFDNMNSEDVTLMRRLDRNFGALFGLAYGDAMGAPVEFDGYVKAKRFVENLDTVELPLKYGVYDDLVALVTDDTQMAIALADAIIDSHSDAGTFSVDVLRPRVINRFVEWMKSPQNNRAPGNACMRACRKLDELMQTNRTHAWLDATQIDARGCGANMRVAPLALANITWEQMAGAAQMQAALTHGHPVALAATELTAALTRALATEQTNAQNAISWLREYIADNRTNYRREWLGTQLAMRWWAQHEIPWHAYDTDNAQTHMATDWYRDVSDECSAFAVFGWEAMTSAIDEIECILEERRDEVRNDDICAWVGEGWTADEAFAGGLLAFLLESDDAAFAIRRGAQTSGDSDSIASIAGTFAGAVHGFAGWPASWMDDIEYADDLTQLAGGLTILEW